MRFSPPSRRIRRRIDIPAHGPRAPSVQSSQRSGAMTGGTMPAAFDGNAALCRLTNAGMGREAAEAEPSETLKLSEPPAMRCLRTGTRWLQRPILRHSGRTLWSIQANGRRTCADVFAVAGPVAEALGLIPVTAPAAAFPQGRLVHEEDRRLRRRLHGPACVDCMDTSISPRLPGARERGREDLRYTARGKAGSQLGLSVQGAGR